VSRSKLRGLQEIPGVGKAVEADLMQLGIYSVDELRNENAEDLYKRLMAQQGQYVDRCMLYVFRCAVYYANGGCDPAKLLWWNWKDK
jgi:hypothetical protein